jgi:putative glutamine amidotransferase
MPGRPLIGVCAALEHARWSVWDMPADLLPRMYVAAVQRAGGAAVMLPVDAGWIEDPDGVLDRLDGLVLAGGADVDPASYGAEPHAETRGMLAERDACEIALYEAALKRGLPVLGICRGLQIINVAAGGTLLQHVPDVSAVRHTVTPGSFTDSAHPVDLADGSLVARIVGANEVLACSHHHQAIDVLGDGLRVTGNSSPDGLPEAIEDSRSEFALGVQWHPEADPGDRVVPAFVAASARQVH